MRKGGGKAKGASFEREVCKRLSLWVTDGKHEDCFWRSAMSGGRSTVAAKKGKRLAAQAGDISALTKDGERLTNRFLAECKTYKTLNYEGLIKGTGNLIKFWRTARTEAARYQKLPMMIAKQNQQPVTVCLTWEGLLALRIPRLSIVVSVHHEMLHIVLFDEFLATAVPPNDREQHSNVSSA